MKQIDAGRGMRRKPRSRHAAQNKSGQQNNSGNRQRLAENLTARP